MTSKNKQPTARERFEEIKNPNRFGKFTTIYQEWEYEKFLILLVEAAVDMQIVNKCHKDCKHQNGHKIWREIDQRLAQAEGDK